MPTERIIHGARDEDGHWTAWFADAPEVSFGGRTPVQTLVRLFATLSPPCTFADIWPQSGLSNLHTGRFEVSIGVMSCPDCAGTGKYVGLHAIELCKECNGHGQVRWHPALTHDRN